MSLDSVRSITYTRPGFVGYSYRTYTLHGTRTGGTRPVEYGLVRKVVVTKRLGRFEIVPTYQSLERNGLLIRRPVRVRQVFPISCFLFSLIAASQQFAVLAVKDRVPAPRQKHVNSFLCPREILELII